MAVAEINGVPIRYEDSGGEGPPVLFSHGFLMDHTMFDPQVAQLADRYRCIRWDERGFGDTPATAPFTYWDSADDAIGVLDACGVSEPAVLVGMSQGGFLSLRAALAHPTRVRALVLIDSQAGVDDAETLAGYDQMLDGFMLGDEATRNEVATNVAGLILGNEALAAEWIPRWIARLETQDLRVPGRTLLDRDDITDRLGEIGCPVLVIHGTADQAISMERARAVCDGVADCRGLVEIEGAAHAPNLSHPEPVNAAIESFLAGL